MVNMSSNTYIVKADCQHSCIYSKAVMLYYICAKYSLKKTAYLGIQALI